MRLLLAALVGLLMIQTPWERAIGAAEAGDLAGAEAKYRTLLQEDPNDPNANYNLGTVLVWQRRFDEARPHLQLAALENEPRGAAPFNLGNTDLEPAFADTLLPERDDRLSRSIESYKAALRADPADDDARWNLELARRLLQRDQPPPTGGGGGGGGGDGPPQEGERRPNPTAGGGAGPQPRMSEAEAENLLRSAQQQELEVQQERLKKPQPPGPIMP